MTDTKQIKWFRVTEVGFIPEKEGRRVRYGQHEVALFNLGEEYLAVENQCPHKGGPLADGIVAGKNVFCPLHNWKINLVFLQNCQYFLERRIFCNKRTCGFVLIRNFIQNPSFRLAQHTARFNARIRCRKKEKRPRTQRQIQIIQHNWKIRCPHRPIFLVRQFNIKRLLVQPIFHHFFLITNY